MAGSASTSTDTQRRNREGSKHSRQRSPSAQDSQDTRADSFDTAHRRAEREHVRGSRSGISDPPRFPASHKFSPPSQHRHRGRSGERARSPASTLRKSAIGDTRPGSSRRERSAERNSHHPHHSSETSLYHKRRHSRSPSRSNRYHKRRRDSSPVAIASRTDYSQTTNRAQSPKHSSFDRPPNASVTNVPTHAPQHQQKSRSPISRRDRGVDEINDFQSLERPRERDREYTNSEPHSASKQERRSRYSRSPSPSSHHRPAWKRGKESANYRRSSHRSTRYPHNAPTGPSRRSPSPSVNTFGDHHEPEASENPESTTAEGHQQRSRHRSLSRDSRRSNYSDRVRDKDMYNRGPYDPRYGHYPYNNSYPPSSYSPHAGTPPHGYHSQHSSHSHQQSQPGVPYYQPRPGKQYGGTPNHPVHPSRPPPRNGPSGRDGRGHFSNLSWTPGDASKSTSSIKDGEDGGESKASTTEASSTHLQSVVVADPEDEDNPFRPPADLRAEDESVRKKRKVSTGEGSIAVPASESASTKMMEARGVDAGTPKNKISFSIKGRASASTAEKAPPTAPRQPASLDPARKAPIPLSPLVQNNIPKSRNYEGNSRVEGAPRKPSPPPVRVEKVKKKRLKERPELSDEFAHSESVYYRKTGNDSVVGSGTYGKVYKAIHVYTGTPVALKKIRMEGERDGFPVTAIREIKLLQSLNHLNVVALQEVMVERNDCFMVFEYLSHDLTGLLNHPSFILTAAHKKHLAKQLFEGLNYLHGRGVLHRDIKAANILISNKGELKLADFGLARFYQKHQRQDYTNRVITIWYRSPELLLGETQYGPAVDIWSAACVLVEIFTRHAIFPGDGGEINQLDKIYNVLGTPSRSEWPSIDELQWFTLLRPRHRIPSTFAEKYRNRISSEAFDLLQAMFAYDPNNRPTAADVLEHPYFVTEEPAPEQTVELALLEGDWHEFESKALRKEKERQEREARRREREGSGAPKEKKGDDVMAASGNAKGDEATA